MGFGVHEGPFACQSQRQPSDYCAGKLIFSFFVFYLTEGRVRIAKKKVKILMFVCTGCKGIL